MPRQDIIYKNRLYFLALVLGCAVLYPSVSRAQISNITADLMNGWKKDSRGQAGGMLIEQSYNQFYLLGVRGFIYHPNLLDFQLRSSYSDINTRYGVESTNNLRHRKDFGFYDADATLFPKNGFRLRAHARRQKVDFSNTGVPSGIDANYYKSIQTVDTYGFDVHVPGNTFYPRIDASLQRDLQKCLDPCSELYYRTDFARLSIANDNRNGTNYTADYSGIFVRDFANEWSRNDHQVTFRGRSKVSEQMKINANGRLQIRDEMSNRNIDIIGDYDGDGSTRHRFRAINSDNSISSNTHLRNTRNLFEHRAFIGLSRTVNTIIGGTYQMQTSSVAGNALQADRATLFLQGDYQESLSNALILALTASVDGGLERGFGVERRFVQDSRLGGGVTVRLNDAASVQFRNDITYQTMLYGGDFAQNFARITANARLGSDLTLDMNITRNDAAFLYLPEQPGTSNMVFEGYATWVASSYLTLRADHSERMTSSVFSDRTSRSVFGLVVNNLIRDLSVNVNAERSISTLTRFEQLRFHGELRYRFHAFMISAAYQRASYGGIATENILLEIRRPINIDYRH